MSRREWLGLAGLVILGGLVRFAAIGSRLHVDDAYTWLVVSQPSVHAFLHALAATENTPPLSYLILTPLPVNNPVWLRLPAVVEGTLLAPAFYLALRGNVPRQVALISALGVAVAPFLISFSDIARGFMLEDLALVIALGAVLRLAAADGAAPGRRRWWVVFSVAGAAALYSEYSAAVFLIALLLASFWLGRPARLRLALAGAVPFAALIPWIPQILDAEHQIGRTKLNPMFATPSLSAVRDVVVTLAFGENGGTMSSSGRWLEFALIVFVAAGVGWLLRRGWQARSERERHTLALLALTLVLTLIGHALAPVLGIDVFTERYMTILVPLAVALGSAATLSVDRPVIAWALAAALTAFGAAEVARRWHGEYEPSVAPVRLAAQRDHPRTILTNTPLVLFYLRSMHPQYDRPSNLGPGRAGSCARPCLVIDDTRRYGGTPRKVTGSQRLIGPYLLTLER